MAAGGAAPISAERPKQIASSFSTIQSCPCILQLEPAGLQMVQLPFSDDIRTPEDEPAFVGVGHPVANAAAIDAAADMIAALSLPDFYSGCTVNPALQRHYQVGSALCLTS